MRWQTRIADIGVGLIGGYVGTKVMEPVAMKLYEWESEEDRRREDAVRPGPPYEIAARKTTQMLRLKLSEQQLQRPLHIALSLWAWHELGAGVYAPSPAYGHSPGRRWLGNGRRDVADRRRDAHAAAGL